jgi:hypothetical protein
VRGWSTSDGLFLLEEAPGRFLLAGPDGRVRAVYASGAGAEYEDMYSTSYTLEDGELRKVFTMESDSGRKRVEREVVLRGLTPAAVEHVEARVKAELEAQAVAAQERERAKRARLEAFAAALPERGGRFVFRYEGSTIVISGPDGRELWREVDAPCHGKHRFEQLRRILKKRYGRSFTFTADLPDTDSRMLFNPE